MGLTYNGTTAGSTLTNPPLMIVGQIAGGAGNGPLPGGRVWAYNSTNAPSDLAGAGAISDAYQLGMKAGDFVLGITATSLGSTSGYPWIGFMVGPITSTGGGQISSNAST